MIGNNYIHQFNVRHHLHHLLVDPVLLAVLPVAELLGLEPEGDLLVGGLHSVGAVADVMTNLDTEITSDGARGGVSGVGGSQHDTTSLDSVETLPYHRQHGATSHVLDQTSKEGFGGQIGVVVLQEFLRSLHELHGHELEALVLKPLDDLAADAAMDGVRLDHDEGSLIVAGHFVRYKVSCRSESSNISL